MQDLHKSWQAVLGELEIVLSAANFQTWLKGTDLVEVTDTSATIYVPNIFTRQWIQDKYHEQILEALQKSFPTATTITYVTTRAQEDSPTQEEKPPVQTQRVATSAPPSNFLSGPSQPAIGFQPNSRYRFDNFITGSSNKLAFSAAQLVSEKPGEMYNPLFLYGPAGVGKTHLLWAISNKIHEDFPQQNILYLTSEEFINTFLAAIRKGEKFTDKYRTPDVLLVDDMQFIAGKERTQEEFFHTFNALHQSNKQIVLCSDRPPKEIPTLEERLRSRFEWGMVADIQPPDFETRVAILMNKAQTHNLVLPLEAAEFIATHISTNIRELEGALIKVIAHARLHNQNITLELAMEVLKLQTNQQKNKFSPKEILQKTAEYYTITLVDITGTKRSKEIVVPRQVAMYIMREELGMSFPRIAQSLGGKDHTTIMHGVKKITMLLQNDTMLSSDIESIKKLVSA